MADKQIMQPPSSSSVLYPARPTAVQSEKPVVRQLSEKTVSEQPPEVQQAQALEKLKAYTSEGTTYDIAKALSEGVSTEILSKAGFSPESIQRAQTLEKLKTYTTDGKAYDIAKALSEGVSAETLTKAGFVGEDINTIQSSMQALETVKKYSTDNKSYDISRALSEGVTTDILIKAGFSPESIQQAQQVSIPASMGSNTSFEPRIDLSVIAREQELKDAIAFSEKVKSGEIPASDITVGQFDSNYWASIEDIKQKLQLIEQAKQVAYGQLSVSDPVEYAKYVELATSPYAKHTSQGVTIDWNAAVSSGVPDEKLKSWGLTEAGLASIKAQNVIVTKYGNAQKAIDAGAIDVVNVAYGADLATVEQKDAAQTIIDTKYKGDIQAAIKGGDEEAVYTLNPGLRVVDLQLSVAERRHFEQSVLPTLAPELQKAYAVSPEEFTRAIVQQKEEFEKTTLLAMPQEYQDAYAVGDTKTLERLESRYKLELQEFERWIHAEAPNDLKIGYLTGGVDGYEAAVKVRESKRLKALTELERLGYRYTYEELGIPIMTAFGDVRTKHASDSYDIAGFLTSAVEKDLSLLRTTPMMSSYPQDPQTIVARLKQIGDVEFQKAIQLLRDAGFDDKSINNAKEYVLNAV